MKKTVLVLLFLLGVCTTYGQFGFDWSLLPEADMDFSQTMDTGNYEIIPVNGNDTRFYGRKETDSSFSGFTYSNISDSAMVIGYQERAAYPAKGANDSWQYAVLHGAGSMLEDLMIGVRHTNEGTVYGFFATNAVKTVLSMELGDSTAKKFGGANGTDPDWLLLTVKGYHFFDTTRIDSLSFYLADFRSSDTAEHYIVKDWRWVNLTSFGRVDSLTFSLTSSDTDSTGVMRTPYYYCVDNFSVEYIGAVGDRHMRPLEVFVYPNPVADKLYLDVPAQIDASVFNISGQLVMKQRKCRELEVATLIPGLYYIKLSDPVSGRSGIQRFIKK